MTRGAEKNKKFLVYYILLGREENRGFCSTTYTLKDRGGAQCENCQAEKKEIAWA